MELHKRTHGNSIFHYVIRHSAQDYPTTTFDISKIDFERLRKEFERNPRKNTTVQNLRQAVEQRLQRLLLQNPLRTDYQQHYEQIVSEYNREKHRVTVTSVTVQESACIS